MARAHSKAVLKPPQSRRWRVGARPANLAKPRGLRQPSDALAQGLSCQPPCSSRISQAVALGNFLFVVVNWRSLVPKRRRAAAVQDAGALARGRRTSRSVVECASPLALWPKACLASHRVHPEFHRPSLYTALCDGDGAAHRPCPKSVRNSDELRRAFPGKDTMVVLALHGTAHLRD